MFLYHPPPRLPLPQAEEVEKQEERKYIRRYARRSWPRFWCSMVRHNLIACVTDVLEGIRAPSVLRRRKGTPTRRAVGCRCLLCPCPCPRLRARRRGSAAATVPVPATPASRNLPSGGFDPNKENETDRRRKGWTLPPKLRAAGEGAGAWGAEIGSSSTLKLSATDGHSSGGRYQHRHGRGGSAASETTVVESVCNTGRSSGSYYTGGGGGGGSGEEEAYLHLRRPGGGSSGRSISTSIFATTPVPSDFPRKKDFGRGDEEEEEKVDLRLRRTGGLCDVRQVSS